MRMATLLVCGVAQDVTESADDREMELMAKRVSPVNAPILVSTS
jgi:hypothetical protein